ncbi:unnamed protein product, partial [marine sediment metagenome]
MHTCYVYDLQNKKLLYQNSYTYVPQKAYLNYDGSYMTHFKQGSEQNQTVIITNLKTKKTDAIKFVDRLVESDGINLISVYKDGNDNKVEIQPIANSDHKNTFTIPCKYGTIKKLAMGQGFITCLAKQANNTILFSQDLNDTKNIYIHKIFEKKCPDNFPLLQVSPRGSKIIVQIRQAAGTILDIHDLENQTTHSINLKESFTENLIKPLDEQTLVLFNKKDGITLFDIETQTKKTIPIPCEFKEFEKYRLGPIHTHNSLQLVSSFIPNIYQGRIQA